MPQPIDPFYEDAKRAFVLASDYEALGRIWLARPSEPKPSGTNATPLGTS